MRRVAEVFKASDYPKLLVGLELADDAAVYQLGEDLGVIQTVDFVTPMVDDPYQYGAIAAANALSDVYAMGGRVVLALNIAAFPETLPVEMLGEILRGGAEKVAEAGGIVAGGHTIDDDEPKYGLAVMGTVHPDRVWRKGGAQPGDLLILTKPLGSGIITTAAKADVAEEEHIRAATDSMLTLNRRAAEVLEGIGPHAVTDITGFALLGHASEMAAHSHTRLRFDFQALPFLEGAKRYANEWLFPAGTCRNQDAYQRLVSFDPQIPAEMQMLLYTPETSGGLLAAIAPEKLGLLRTCFAAREQPYWIIGDVLQGEGLELALDARKVS